MHVHENGRPRTFRLVRSYAAAALFDVVGNDGGDDVAQRHANDSDFRRRRAQSSTTATALRSGGSFCFGLHRDLVCVQHRGCS